MLSEISSKGVYVIAFSGGADSRYLLEKFLEKIEEKFLEKSQIIVAHYNHNIRAEESLRDQDFCREISQKNGLIFETKTREISGENNAKLSENTARNLRYAFLESVRQKYFANWIVTAHHKDDQAETIFLQFLRGGGVNAMTGMKEFSEDRKVFRPLLKIQKFEILDFLSEKKLDFVEDSTNTESDYTRNFLRNEVFPLIDQKFPDFSRRIAEKSSYFQNIQTHFEQEAEKFLEKNNFQKGVLRQKFLEKSSAVQFEIIKSLLAPDFCSESIFREISGFFKTAQSGKKFLLKNHTFQIFGENVFVEKIKPQATEKKAEK